jgi:hypothetical protein
VTIGVHAGTSLLSDRIAFIVSPGPGIKGICTSSATVGHSISFGVADSVTVFSHNPAYADAWATAICNEVTRDNTSVLSMLDPAEVQGVFVIIGDWTCSWGNVPGPVPAKDRRDLITGGLV